jgi:hypothetical protein
MNRIKILTCATAIATFLASNFPAAIAAVRLTTRSGGIAPYGPSSQLLLGQGIYPKDQSPAIPEKIKIEVVDRSGVVEHSSEWQLRRLQGDIYIATFIEQPIVRVQILREANMIGFAADIGLISANVPLTATVTITDSAGQEFIYQETFHPVGKSGRVWHPAF